MRAYIVKTPDGYLHPHDGDVSWTDDESKAGHFLDEEEADDTAQNLQYPQGSYRVIPVEVTPEKLVR